MHCVVWGKPIIVIVCMYAELKAEIAKAGGTDDVEPAEEPTTVRNGGGVEMELGMTCPCSAGSMLMAPPLPDPQSEEETSTTGERGGGEEEKGGMSAEEMKYWTAVKENPSDFNSWTALLQLVERKVCHSLLPP